MPFLRARPFFVALSAGACLCVVALSTGAPAAAAESVAPRARPLAPVPAAALADHPSFGLIVKLRDAPSHETAQALHTAPAQADRLARVLGEVSAPALASTRPVGRASHLLDFGRPLTRAESAALIAKLAARPDVQWVEANTREHRANTPDDPQFTNQFWLQTVRGSNANVLSDRLRGVPGFQTAWNTTTGSPSIVVAVLDTGITVHPEIDNHILPGYDFVTDPVYANDGNGRDADPSDPGDFVSQADINANPAAFSGCTIEDSSWHGTDIAGIIGASTNDGVGVAGVHWNARILPVRVAGKCGAEVTDIIDGMRWAAGLAVAGAPINPNPARVINISFTGTTVCGQAYQDAIDELAALPDPVVVVAAAGNARGAIERPASCNGVVAVGAVNRDGFKTSYSNFGAGMTLMTVGGDYSGEGIWGPYLADGGLLTIDNNGLTSPGTAGYAYVFGTSFSTPVVSATVSLMLSLNPSLTVAQIIDGLKRSARPHVTAPRIGACSSANPWRCICTTTTCGAGLLDAPQALIYAQNPTSYTAPAQTAAVIDNTDVDQAVALGPDGTTSTTPPPTPTPAPSGGGGGAVDGGWLWGLALATIAAAIVSRRRPAR